METLSNRLPSIDLDAVTCYRCEIPISMRMIEEMESREKLVLVFDLGHKAVGIVTTANHDVDFQWMKECRWGWHTYKLSPSRDGSRKIITTLPITANPIKEV
jgi:hypothetical protein